MRLTQTGVSITQSWARNAYENAIAESFWKTVKYEEVYRNEYHSLPQARSHLQGFIREYNGQRLHSSLGYRTPDEVEVAYLEHRL